MTVTLMLLLLGIGIAVGIPSLLLAGYILGRLRPVWRWREGRKIHPQHNVAMRSLGLPERPKYRGTPLKTYEDQEETHRWPRVS